MAAEHVPAHDRGADVGQRLLHHTTAFVYLSTLEPMRRPPHREGERPFMQPISANAERVLRALLRPSGVAVERHGDPETELGHGR
jgi:hypothetical protein